MQEHREVMEEVKNIMVNFPIRAHFDPTLPTVLETNAARRKGLGYYLMQLHNDGKRRVVEA